jgi:hypothetical protein
MKWAVLFGAVGLQLGTGAGCALWAHAVGADTDFTLLAFVGGMVGFWAIYLFAFVGYSIVKVIKGSRTGDYS